MIKPAATDLDQWLQAIPAGYSQMHYQGHRYGVRRSDFGTVPKHSTKIAAERLDGGDFISANVYWLSTGPNLKPCEMPGSKVLHFLQHCTPDAASPK